MTEKIKDYLLKMWTMTSVSFLIMITIYIILYIFTKGISSIDIEFLLKSPKGFPIGSEGGIFPAIIGSLMLMLISSVFASFIAIGISIYLVFYCESRRVEGVLHLAIQCIAGIPSIVLGLFGYTFLVLNMKFGRSLLSGSITLAIMIFPYIQIRVEKILREIDLNIINSSYALGVSKYYMIFKLALPICRGNIVSTIVLAGSLAMGASAPIILTAAVITAPVPDSLKSPVMALPFHLYLLIGEGISLEKSYATALVLIVIVFLIKIVSLLFVRRKEE